MAGKRHHYIPRFLQRGFSIEKDSKFFCCLCKKDIVKENIVIENVGLENKFYTLDGDSTIDDRITEKETFFYSGMVRDLLNGSYKMNDVESLADFIFHMEIRTKNLRSNFTNTAAYLIEQMRARLLSKESISRYFIKNIFSEPSKMDGLLNEQLIELNVPKVFWPEIKIYLYNNIHICLPEIAGKLALQLIPLFDKMVLSDIPEAAKKGHIKGLGKDGSLKVKEYEKLNYKVVNVEQSLILGDCLVVFEVDGERKYKPFYEKDDVLKALYMPLNSYSILYAAKSPEHNPNIENINSIIAQCSTDFFISKEPVSDVHELRKLIGINSYLLSDECMDGILDELIGDKLI